VEDSWQLERLVELGCQKVQGYLFSPPLPATAASSLVLARGAGLSGG
jgi:EAL domain-containing protein (putative c-di-GMP-specific phosphodiesterase class I)